MQTPQKCLVRSNMVVKIKFTSVHVLTTLVYSFIYWPHFTSNDRQKKFLHNLLPLSRGSEQSSHRRYCKDNIAMLCNSVSYVTLVTIRYCSMFLFQLKVSVVCCWVCRCPHRKLEVWVGFQILLQRSFHPPVVGLQDCKSVLHGLKSGLKNWCNRRLICMSSYLHESPAAL